MTPELIREFERILIACFGGVSLVLGWDLFRRGIFNPSIAQFAKGDWRISLQKVGPGVFFALFGAAILCFGIFNGAKKTTTTTTNPTTGSEEKQIVKWEYYSEKDSRRKNITKMTKSINTVIYSDYAQELSKNVMEGIVNDPEAKSIQSALVKLQQFRDGWMLPTIFKKSVIRASLANQNPMNIEDLKLRQSVIKYNELRSTDLLGRKHD